MRIVNDSASMASAFAEATSEALSCFADGRLYLEKLIAKPRHVEVQILGDDHGNLVYLGDRDCSLQRSHQKVLEESPAAALSQATREKLRDYAIALAKAAKYRNAGTVEFVVDEHENYYFLEINTRIQVEHPVTEMVTGVNIVREQLRIASGLSINFSSEDVSTRGHAIECRINAEDPQRNFMPCPGKIENLHLPSGFGVRVDTVIHPQFNVSPRYDSMVAKIIVHGRTRNEAICRMRRALEETIITGINTNIPLHYMLMYHPEYLANRLDTGFLERNLQDLLKPLGNGMAL
jgi:acetyl-CoA carboxylase biotin carboxylase subunit